MTAAGAAAPGQRVAPAAAAGLAVVVLAGFAAPAMAGAATKPGYAAGAGAARRRGSRLGVSADPGRPSQARSPGRRRVHLKALKIPPASTRNTDTSRRQFLHRQAATGRGPPGTAQAAGQPPRRRPPRAAHRPDRPARPGRRLRPFGSLRLRGDLGNLDVGCLHRRYGDRLDRWYGDRLDRRHGVRPGGLPRPSMAASAAATSASPKSASDGEAAGLPGEAGVDLSKNLSSSTGTGMTSVLLRSPATSTTVCSSRSCSAAGSRAITFAAAARRLEAWYSPSAVMILAGNQRRYCPQVAGPVRRPPPGGTE